MRNFITIEKGKYEVYNYDVDSISGYSKLRCLSKYMVTIEFNNGNRAMTFEYNNPCDADIIYNKIESAILDRNLMGIRK